MLYNNKIKTLLATNKISIEVMAEKMGLTRNGLQRKLAGHSDLYVSELLFIAEYFKVVPAYFFSDDDSADENDKLERDIDRVFDAIKEVVKEKIVKK